VIRFPVVCSESVGSIWKTILELGWDDFSENNRNATVRHMRYHDHGASPRSDSDADYTGPEG
jgi:hypothetical protein